jgi:hypothetical protein
MKRYGLALKRRSIFLLLAVIGLVLLLYGFSILFAGEKTAPGKLLAESLQKSISSRTFRYHMEVKTGKQGFLSKVDGEWVAPDRIHIKGNMFNTPVEFIQVGDVTYMRDIWTKRWMELRNNRLGQAQLFVMELGPLNFLNFGDVSGVRYAGYEKIKEGKMLLLECQPQLTGSFFNQKYQGYRCKLWIDPKDHRVRQVLLQAASQDDDLPTIMLKFWDFDRPAAIEPPKLN